MRRKKNVQKGGKVFAAKDFMNCKNLLKTVKKQNKTKHFSPTTMITLEPDLKKKKKKGRAGGLVSYFLVNYTNLFS